MMPRLSNQHIVDIRYSLLVLPRHMTFFFYAIKILALSMIPPRTRDSDCQIIHTISPTIDGAQNVDGGFDSNSANLDS